MVISRYKIEVISIIRKCSVCICIKVTERRLLQTISSTRIMNPKRQQCKRASEKGKIKLEQEKNRAADEKPGRGKVRQSKRGREGGRCGETDTAG